MKASKFSALGLLVFGLVAQAVAGVGAGGGGDAKAIEFLSYAKFACTWMSSNDQLRKYSDRCSSSVDDIRASLGDYNRTARLEFTSDDLTDSNGVSKPAVTTPDGRIRINRGAWITMSLTDRAKTAAMEMSVICQIDDRYSIGDEIGGIWNLAHGENRPVREIPVGTRILGYTPITIPANTNTLGFPTITETTIVNFSEVFAGDDGFFEEQISGSTVKNVYGHVYSLGANELTPVTLNFYCSGFTGRSLHKCSEDYPGAPNVDHFTSTSQYSVDVSQLPGSEGVLIMMPDVQNQDVTIQNLTINSIEPITNLSDERVTDVSGGVSREGITRSAVVLDASTDVNPDKVVKIIVYSVADPTLALLSKEFQRHFAIVFPEPKAE